MSSKPPSDWNPYSEEILQDQMTAYDQMRTHCPVAYSEENQWSLFGYDDIYNALHDHKVFSNKISKHLSVPNGMDPPQHTPYRELIEPYFSSATMAEFEPKCRRIAKALVATLPRHQNAEIITTFAQNFALQVQCTFLGWPFDMQESLRQWSHKSQAATLAQDRLKLTAVADEFSCYITTLLQQRRDAGDQAANDVTTSLLHARVDGKLLTDEEIVSILRNWTAGEIGTIAASIGILIHFIAAHPEFQQELRDQPEKLLEAIDEILRIHGPLVVNRRRTTCPVTLGQRNIQTEERVSLYWVSANRDEKVFEDAKNFRWGRDQSKNLLYGAGIHVCPGLPLARLELQIVMEELLAHTSHVKLSEVLPTNAIYPASGFSSLIVWVE